MKYLAILCWAILYYCNSSTAQTVPVTNIQQQVRNAGDAVLGLTPNNPNFYVFNELPNTIQGVIIQLAPPENKRVFLQSNNCRLQFANPNFVISLEVNFDNTGFQTITSGTPLLNIGWITPPASFMTIGEHNLKVRFLPVGSSNFINREYRASVTPACNQLFIDNTRTVNNGTTLTTGNTIALWDNPNCPNAEPLLLSEGYDATNVQFPESYRFRGDALINNLLTLGYKVYILNYNLANQDMRSNAAVYTSALKFVSQINNNRDVFAAGISMGGIITRYALAKAESDGISLPVSAYLSMDAPHQGAVVDAEFQAFINQQVPDLPATQTLASKQLLINHVLEPNQTSHLAFFNELKSLNGDGYPHKIPTVGVAFSKNVPNSFNNINWLTFDVLVAGIPINSKHKDFTVKNEWAQAGSFLPAESTNLQPSTTVNLFLGLNFTVPSGEVRVVRNSHPTFIPHNSALDKVNGLSKFSTTLIPTEATNDFFHDEIPLSISTGLFNLFNSNITTIAANETYNFTALKGQHIRQNINVLGTLGVNRNLASGSSLASTLEPKLNLPLQKLFTNPCTPITINVNGTVDIGDNLNANIFNANFTLKAGDILRINSGATLGVRQGSQLIIGNGATLIIDGSSNINLQNLESSIVIRNGGTLLINGQFNFSGSGYFRFEQGNIFTLNSNLLLRGVNPNNRMISLADGASLNISGRKLTLENGLVRRETGSTPTKHIRLTNGSSIQATNVTFEDNSTFGDRAFIYAENPTDPDNSTSDVDYGFTNCTFQGNGNLVQLNTLTAISNDYEWLNLNVDFTDCTFTNGTAFNANRCRVATFLRCTLNRSGIILSNTYWLDMRSTTMRGFVSNPIIFNPSGTGIKLKSVVHGEIYQNSTIDNYNIGIDATEGYNHHVKLMDGAKVQNCYTAVKLIGGVNNPYGYDWGMIYMDCASLINNVYGITGKDIQFNMYGRGGTTVMHNVSTEIQQNLTDWKYVDAEFLYRNWTTDVWFHDSYWTGGGAPNAATQFRFKQNTPQSGPWTGTIHLDDPIGGSDTRINPCGGLGLRGSDPFEGRSEISLNGGRYNTKVQHDAAMIKMRAKKFEDAVNLFKPLANVPDVIYERSSSQARHFIDNARISVPYKSKGVTPRDANDGWIPEAIVHSANDFTKDNLLIYPSPAMDFIQIPLGNQDYIVKAYDVAGRLIMNQNAKGDTRFDVNNWESGIYIIDVLEKGTQKHSKGKVVVQH